MRLKYAFKFIGFFGFLSIPHILNKMGIKPMIFCTWDEIAAEFWTNLGHHLLSLWTTFYIGALSILISIILGVLLGMLFGYFNKFLGFFETVMKFIWSIPLIAVAVYLNIFINSTVVFVIITGVFLGVFPILSQSYQKCIEPNDGILSMVASFNLSKREEFWHFRFREVVIHLVVPLAQSVPLAYIGVTMGEYTVGRVAGTDAFGLGSDFQFAMQYSKFPNVYVSIILMMFLVYVSGEFFEIIITYRFYFALLKSKIAKIGKE